jgi:hypothetical protein
MCLSLVVWLSLMAAISLDGFWCRTQQQVPSSKNNLFPGLPGTVQVVSSGMTCAVEHSIRMIMWLMSFLQ